MLATITNNFADVYVYKNISLLKTTTIALRPTITKRRSGHLRTEEIKLLTLLKTALEHTTTILYRAYLTIPDLFSRQINKQLSKTCPPIMSVIKEADKGGAITIIDKDDYITDCNTILEDNRTYHKTTTDMMEAHLQGVVAYGQYIGLPITRSVVQFQPPSINLCIIV